MVKKTIGDITRIKTDVIVNAANTQLFHGGGVAAKIAQIGGFEVEKESKEVGFCPLGSFVVTSAGNLPAKKVIHVPTIDYLRDSEHITYEELEDAWRMVLQWCFDNGYRKISVPLLGTGVVGLDKAKVEEILQSNANNFNELDVSIIFYR